MQTVISKDGTKIAYDKVGQGPALVMVAGAFSYRKYPAQLKLVDLLAQHFTVYNYDRRGRGDSGDTQPYAPEREVEDIKAIIDAAGGSAYVWGLSSGAALVLRAAGSGLNITKLAVHEPPFIVNDTDRQPPADFPERTAELIAAGQKDAAIKYFMVEGMGAPGFVMPMLRIMPGVWKRLKAVANTLPYDALLLKGYTSGKPLSGKEWAAATMPTLVMVGTESPALFQHTGEALVKVLPNATLVSKKGLGHTKALSAKDIAPVLIDFFQK